MQYSVKICLLLTLPMPMSWQISLNSSSSIQPRPLVSHRLNSASSLPAISVSGLLISQNLEPQLGSLPLSIMDLLARLQISGDWRSSHITLKLEDTCSVMTSTSVLRLCPPPPRVSSHMWRPGPRNSNVFVIVTSNNNNIIDHKTDTQTSISSQAQVQISTRVKFCKVPANKNKTFLNKDFWAVLAL